MIRCYLNKFIFIDILKHFFEGHLDGRREDNLLITSCRTHVGELLGLADIHIQVSVPSVLSHNLSSVNFFTRVHEELASVEEFVHGVCDSLTCFEGNERTIGSVFDIALIWLIILKSMSHNCFTLRCCKKVTSESHQASGRDFEFEKRPVSPRFHVDEGSFSSGGDFDGCSYELLRHLDAEFLDRLASLSVDSLVEHLGLTYLKFEALSSHLFDQY